MSYVAPDGNTYKYKAVTNRTNNSGWVKYVYSNNKFCFCSLHDYYNGDGIYRLLTMYDNVSVKYVVTVSSLEYRYDCYGVTQYPTIGISFDFSGDNKVVAFDKQNNQVSNSTAVFCDANENPNIPIFDTLEDCYAYLTAPEVFQIPSFSFSGSILPGQNSSLSQGSCSLASPYTTSFSFEGKCIEKYSAPNGQVYNYKYSYYGVMTYQEFTADFDVYSNIKIGVLSTDRRAYALYNGVKTRVDIYSAPAGTYTNAAQGTTPNDDRVQYYSNTGTSNHIEHCYYSRSGVNGYVLAMTQQDGYPVNFSTTFPTFSTESALLEYLNS